MGRRIEGIVIVLAFLALFLLVVISVTASEYTPDNRLTVNLTLGHEEYTPENRLSVNLTLSDDLVFVSGPTDSCTYSSGDWEIDCTDNCEISTLTEVDGSDVIISGAGTLTIEANIVGYNDIRIDDCTVRCNGGYCFK